jgi:hypothetical protein
VLRGFLGFRAFIASSQELLRVLNRLGLAADDLGDALVAHAQDGGDGFHGEVFAVGLPDCLVPFVP